MAIDVNAINEAVGAIETTGSVADAINTLSSGENTPTLAALGAVNTLVSQGVTPGTGAGAMLGAWGAALSYGSLAESLSDGSFTQEDIAAASAAIGATLARNPNPYLQAVAAYFNGYAIALPYLTRFGHWIGQNAPLPHEINDLFNRALNWILPRDPLALDLDGDGIETLPANGTVLFDHDGDGTKNGTGWIAPDDGILVLDRNGNGLIDNGGELFGDNTIKSDGTRALDGFDALADIDSNGDGIIDTNDGVFSQLRVWRDANSDGKVQNIRRAA